MNHQDLDRWITGEDQMREGRDMSNWTKFTFTCVACECSQEWSAPNLEDARQQARLDAWIVTNRGGVCGECLALAHEE